MYIGIFFLLFLCSCEKSENKITSSPASLKPKGNRYEVALKDPPVIFENARAILIFHEQFPSVVIADNKGEIYKNHPVRKEKQNGFGPLFHFEKDNTAVNVNWFNGSIKFSYKDDQIGREQFFTGKVRYVDSEKFSAKDFLKCEIGALKGLSCVVDCTDSPEGPCVAENVWSDTSNPVIEVNTTSHPGTYAMTKNGSLLYFMREGREISDATIVHKDIKFRKNQRGRYFMNTNSEAACMQSEDYAVYCSQVYPSLAHSSYGLKYSDLPELAKVVQLDFPIEQATFSGRHYCFLSESGDVYCMGDNRCGQITGRHDEIPEFKEPKKLDFLKYPAIGIAVYAGGSCVVLNNGQVQCFGLGASVLRKRRWPDGAYRRSFSWLHGFRPHQICGGGAENGV